MDIYDKLKYLREKNNMSQEELAEKMGYKSKTSIHKIEQKMTDLPLSKVKEFAKVLKTTPSYLMGWEADDDLNVRNESVHQPNANIIATIKIPTYGKASAGNGYLNLSEEIDTFEIPAGMYKPGMFAVNVTGDSMTSSTKSIPDGTVAVADPTMCTSPSLNGKICVFTYNDETFIKQLIINNDGIIRLRSFNSDYEDILVLKPKQLKCEGRVISTFTKQTW